MNLPLKTSIEVGQRYFDKPIYAKPKPIDRVWYCVRLAIYGRPPQTAQAIVVAYQRVRLNWIQRGAA